MNKTFKKIIGATAVVFSCAASVMAQDVYPSKAIKLIVPLGAGGATDVVARVVASKLSQRLGQQVVVENRPGAASQIATQHVSRSAPDGNTLLISFDNHSINPIVKPKLPYDTFKDFTGISLLVRFPLVIAANPSVPGNNLAEFIAVAKKRPGFFNYASTGVGSLNHLAMEDLKRKAGIFVLHVPYGRCDCQYRVST